MTIRVVLAEDNVLVREGLRNLLSTRPDLELVSVCEDAESLARAVEAARPDVVVTDIRMPPSGTDEGIVFAMQAREAHPDLGVVVLSQYDDPSYALRLFGAGSEGRAYLLKERVSGPADIVSAIESVAEKGSVMDPHIVDTLVAAKTRDSRSPLSDLTPRELEVLAAIAEGKSNAAIAESLVLTKRAIEKHVNAIFLKLRLTDAQDVSKRVMAALLFLAEVPPSDT